MAEGHGKEDPKEKKKWYPGMVKGEPPLKGKKDLPTGKPGALDKMAFVITGMSVGPLFALTLIRRPVSFSVGCMVCVRGLGLFGS